MPPPPRLSGVREQQERGCPGNLLSAPREGAMDDGEDGDGSAVAPAPAPAPAAGVVEHAAGRDPDSGVPTVAHFSAAELFDCCVCLDLLYKPIVLVCGHALCFWCVHRAMDGFMESHCPMCRQPYKHFPAICQVLHNLLLKIEPAAYKKREKEVFEMESRLNCFSPQFVDHFTEDTVHICTSLVEQSTSSVINAPVENSSVDKGNSNLEGIVENKTQNLCVSDALCEGCKQLLFQPAVLNCGHVYCEPCLIGLGSDTPRCQVCRSVHPGHLPKVCLQLSNLLEKKFPKEHALRRESSQGLSSRGCEATKRDTKLDSCVKALSMEDMDMLNIHVRVGCDSCGMYPLVGKRYMCKDCKEEIGFDLCEACYDTRSKLPARFNQQHRPDHTFVVVETDVMLRELWREDP